VLRHGRQWKSCGRARSAATLPLSWRRVQAGAERGINERYTGATYALATIIAGKVAEARPAVVLAAVLFAIQFAVTG
jgi:hypothetical protein